MMKPLLVSLLLYSLCLGQTTATTIWFPRLGRVYNLQTEYVLRYMEAAQVHHWARMRRVARGATAYCEYKYGERLPYGG